MKQYSRLVVTAVTIILTGVCCKKDALPLSPNPARTIKFILYTKKDFSGNDKTITFSMFIRNHTKILFDSTLSAMKIRDIPDSTNQLIFEKTVLGDDGSELAAGFRYVIENVGYSSHLDTCKAGETFKAIEFAFQ